MGAMRIAIIDGTGDMNDDQYEAEMRMSFCSQLGNAFGRVNYIRGPSFDGFRVREKAEWAASLLMNGQCNPDDRLFLAGYSRGGSAALIAAEIMRMHGATVTGMVLFDPVGKHIWDTPPGIPANVKTSLTFVRRYDDALVKKYEDTIEGLDLGLDWMCNPIRPGWTENVTPPSGADPRQHVKVEFAASHGALGGVGWQHVTEDATVQPLIADMTRQAFNGWGLQANLHKGSFSISKKARRNRAGGGGSW